MFIICFVQVLKSTSVTDISILSDSLTSDTNELQSILNSGRMHYQLYDKAPQVSAGSLYSVTGRCQLCDKAPQVSAVYTY